MHLSEGYIYHVYNRGNNKQTLFFSREHYLHFLTLIQKNIYNCSDMLAWCLMPNHFHFLIYANQNSVAEINDGSFPRQQFSQGIKQLLSSYTKGINKQKGGTGSLFQQKTKARCVNDGKQSYTDTAFYYIHQNPMKAGLVKRMEDWEFSSFRDYTALRNGKLCNMQLAFQLLDLSNETFYRDSYAVLNEEIMKKIF